MRRSRPPRKPTNPAGSPPSSATSGPRTPAATTFTATSSSATTAKLRARSFHTRSCRLAATIRVTCGSGWPPMRTRPAATCWRSPTTAICRNGMMFPMVEPGTNKPLDREYAETRAKWERLYEVTQIKGDGETHPFLSPNDEFANFERWDKGNLDLTRRQEAGDAGVRICPLGPEERAEAGAGTRRQSLQVRPGRLDRRAYRTGRASRRTISGARLRPASRAQIGRRHPFIKTDKAAHHGLGADRLGLCGGVGHGEHARVDLRRHGAARNLCHHGTRAWRCACSADGTSPPTTPTREARRSSVTPRACRWGAT